MTRISETNHGEKAKLIYGFIMKGIDKNKHVHILRCLEELRASIDDPEENNIIEKEISALSQSYDWYNSLMEGIHAESDRYNSLYTEIQRRIYKELRRVRYAKRKI